MAVLLGCIADDFTGGTDLAGMLVKAGMRTVQLIGVPTAPRFLDADDADAVVIALESRTSSAGLGCKFSGQLHLPFLKAVNLDGEAEEYERIVQRTTLRTRDHHSARMVVPAI